MVLVGQVMQEVVRIVWPDHVIQRVCRPDVEVIEPGLMMIHDDHEIVSGHCIVPGHRIADRIAEIRLGLRHPSGPRQHVPECHHLRSCQVFAVRLVHPVVLGAEREYHLVMGFLLDRTQLFE